MYATWKTHPKWQKKFIELWAPGSNFKTEEHWVSHWSELLLYLKQQVSNVQSEFWTNLIILILKNLIWGTDLQNDDESKFI